MRAHLALGADFGVGFIQAATARKAGRKRANLTWWASVFASAFLAGFVQQYHLMHGFTAGDGGVERAHDGLLWFCLLVLRFLCLFVIDVTLNLISV
jgi:methylphosphotriester-DNA--protein-cysteine methyltransferase